MPAVRILISLVAVLGFLLPASASAAAWSAPTDLSSPGGQPNAVTPIFAKDGSLTVFWRQRDNGATPRLLASTRLAGSTSWSAPTYVSPPNFTVNSDSIRAVGAPDGSVSVVWCQNETNETRVAVATRAAGGTSWSTPVGLTPDFEQTESPTIIARGDSSLAVAWRSYGTQTAIQAATRSAAGTWSPVVNLTTLDPAMYQSPQLVVDAADNVTAVWLHRGNADTWVDTARMSAGSTSWGAASTIEYFPHESWDVQAVAAPNGEVTAVWLYGSFGGGGPQPLRSATRDPQTGTWSSPVTITRATEAAGVARMTVDEQSNVTTVWGSISYAPAGVPYATAAISRPAGGVWAPAETVSTPGQITAVAVPFAAADGSVQIVAHTTPDMSAFAAQVQRNTGPGTAYGAQELITASLDLAFAGPAAAAARRTGALAVAWVKGTGSNAVVRVSERAGWLTAVAPPATPTPNMPPEGPAAAPAPTPPSLAAPTPTPEASLRGKTIRIAAVVRLRSGARCRGPVTAVIRAGKLRARGRARLQSVKGACTATGTITLHRAPARKGTVQVRLTGRSIGTRNLLATRIG